MPCTRVGVAIVRLERRVRESTFGVSTCLAESVHGERESQVTWMPHGVISAHDPQNCLFIDWKLSMGFGRRSAAH